MVRRPEIPMAVETLAERLLADDTRAAAAPPVTIVIFGGAGDLAQRKLVPALYNLHVDGLLPARCAIVSTGRKDLTDDGYRAYAREGVEKFSRRPLDEQQWTTFAQRLYFVNLDLQDEGAFPALGARLDIIEHDLGLTG